MVGDGLDTIVPVYTRKDTRKTRAFAHAHPDVRTTKITQAQTHLNWMQTKQTQASRRKQTDAGDIHMHIHIHAHTRIHIQTHTHTHANTHTHTDKSLGCV